MALFSRKDDHEDEHDSGPASPSAPLTTRKAPRIGKSFSSRNPTPIGAIGLVFLLVLLYASFNASNLPLIGGGTTYSALFSTSANLISGDDVRVAGVRVGEVQGVSVVQGKGEVKVTFKVKDGWIGNQSNASIELATLLGQKYLEIDSQGTKSMASGATIPRSRTQAPFDVYPAFTAVTRTIQKINTKQLAHAFNVLSSDFQGTPQSVGPVLRGLSRLSTTISSRDSKLHLLLSKTANVTGVLASRDQDLQKLIRDGNLLLSELNARRTAIHALFLNVQQISKQLEGLVHDNEKTLGPALKQVNGVLSLLKNNEEALERGVSLLGPFYRLFNNVIGNGTWFDNYIQNLSVPGLTGIVTGSG